MNKIYFSEIETVANLDLPWQNLKNKSIIVTGAAGMIGSCLIDVLMFVEKKLNLNINIFAVGRTENKLKKRFEDYLNNKNLKIITQDINEKFSEQFLNVNADYIFHLASNTHPLAYSTDPIGTITTNIIGTKNLLDFATQKSITRFVYASSVEIYGKNRGDETKFTEDYCGYINCNTLRAGYPEAKRCGEALCQAYIKQNNLNIVIPRLSRVYGSTMLQTDSKAIAQFIKKAAANEDIILKSEGKQLYSYTYAIDAVSGLLYCLFYGKNGEAYNISDPNSEITLKDLAQQLADLNGRKVKFEIPDAVESAGYSTADLAILNSQKLQKLGWQPKFPISIGLKNCVNILRETK